jgi:hypothetical protein
MVARRREFVAIVQVRHVHAVERRACSECSTADGAAGYAARP